MNDDLSAVKPDPEVIAVLVHLMETFKCSDGRMIGVFPEKMKNAEEQLFERTMRALQQMGGDINEGMPVAIFPPDVDLDHIVHQFLERGEAYPIHGNPLEDHAAAERRSAEASVLT